MTNLPCPAQAAQVLAVLLLCSACAAQDADSPRSVRIVGNLQEAEDISAVARIHSFWVVASDEGRALQILDGEADPAELHVRGEPFQLVDGETEIDLEALAVDGKTLYALGSHSHKRPRLDKRRWSQNRQRIERVVAENTRHHLFRITVEHGGTFSSVESIDLRAVLADDPVLSPFLPVPGKENGLDLEGLALLGGKLFVGCRSPVLRDGWTPVVVLEYDRPADYELRFVRLDGDGIRAMDPLGEDLVVVSGDAQGRVGEQGIWLWNGGDMLPGEGGAGGLARKLVTLSGSHAAIEGIEILQADAAVVDALVVRDGAADGGAERRRIPLR